MILFIKNILRFLFVSIIAYVVLVIVWGELIPSQLRPNLKGIEGKDDYILQKYREMQEMKNLDILFVGSSHAYRTFDSRIWNEKGYHVFNMGTSSQTHIHTGLLLRELIPKSKPKLVVYEVYPDIFANEGVESNSIFLAYGICKEEMSAVALKSANIKSINELIFAQYKSIVRPDEIIPIIVDTSIQIYRSGGFIEKMDGQFHDSQRHKNGKIQPHQLNAFYSNLDYLKSCNIPTVLVNAPVTTAESGRFKDQVKYDEIMSNFDNYVDLSQLDILSDSLHFYDYHHLNQMGVELFNPYFIDWLENQNIKGFEKN